jgi:hypothetical protein
LGRGATIVAPNNAKVDYAPIMFVFTLDGTADLPEPAPAPQPGSGPPGTPAGAAPEQRN